MTANRTKHIKLVDETTLIINFGVASGRWSAAEAEDMARRCDAYEQSATERYNRCRAAGSPGWGNHQANALWWARGAAAWRALHQPHLGEASGS